MNENLGCNFYLATHPKLSVIRSVAVPIFLRYTPSKRSVFLWVKRFITLSMIWQRY